MIFMHVPQLGDDVYPDIIPQFQPQTAVPNVTSAPFRPQSLDPNAPVPSSDPYQPQPLDPYVPYPGEDLPLPPAIVTPTSIAPSKCGWLCWVLIGIGAVTVTGMAYYTFRRKR